MKIQKNIDVYLVKKKNTRIIDLVQYDTGIQLIFSIKDFEVPTGTTATLYVQKPSGKFVYQESGITISGNDITVNLDNQAITEHEKVWYQVSLKNGIDEITTFTGLMMVQKSLKDAGAAESETVIRAFEELTAEKIDEIKAEAATQLGLIEGKFDALADSKADKNDVANAIKGTLSGSVVFADDVSTIEHNPEVFVHGKNLFDTSKIQVQESTDNIYISAVGEGYIDITTKETYDGNGHCVTWIKLKELCPQMRAGKQYALSATTTAWNKMIYLKEMDLFWSYGTRLVVTEEMLECTVGFYGFNVIREQGFGTCRISNIQVEEGYEITEYTPYIDPTTVNVRRCGKNLIPYPYADSDVTRAGITYAASEKGRVTASGTSEGSYFNVVTTASKGLYFHKGVVYHISGVPKKTGLYYAYAKDASGNNYFDYGEGCSFTPATSGFGAVTIVVSADSTISGVVFEPQIEIGTESTDYESPYEKAEYTPDSDGNVTGITSLSPNMTIYTDTEGIIVDCEYNRDTKQYVDSKTSGSSGTAGTINGTVLSENADFAEVGEWSDGNPNSEDRIGYFVSVDTSEPGKTMVKATSSSDVRGVTMKQPAFAANASRDKYDAEGNLLKQYDYVGFAGFVPVIDNGTCTVNGRCMPADDGTAVPSSNNMGYQVIERIDDSHVLVLVEPQADMMVRIKEDVSELKSDLENKEPIGTAESKVSEHNTAIDAHNDIRLIIEGLTNRLNAVANSEDIDLDQLAEIVTYIKSNRSLIDSITTSKVSVSDIIDNLTTNVANKPLSAAQGVALKSLIDEIVVPTKTSDLTNDSGYMAQPETAQVGQIFKVKSVNEDGTLVLEAVDMPSGGGSVNDVMVNESSIVSDGVANIPYPKTYSSFNKSDGVLGMVKICKSFGFEIYDHYSGNYSGFLNACNIPQSSIDHRIEWGPPELVKISVFDKCLKYAMSDGKGEAWTDTERIAALLRMGCTVDDNGFVKWTAQEEA